MSKQLTQITGFTQLAAKIKSLPDKVKRKEIVKVLGQVANPTLRAARGFAPLGTRKHSRDNAGPGNLKKSIRKKTGNKGINRINAAVFIGPWKTGKNAGWYAHFIAGGTKRGIAPNNFMAKAYSATKGLVTVDAEKRVAAYIQRQINRLSA